MPDPDLLWPWLRTPGPSSAFSFVLPFLISATLGATLASLVTWIEDHLTTGKAGPEAA